MNRNILAICDPEQEYAYRLMDALSRRADFPFEILTFTSAEKLYGALFEKSIQILLIAQPVFHADMRNWPASQIILLWEEEAPPGLEVPGISKYSSVARIMKKIMETAAESGTVPRLVQTDHPVHIFGIYTPVGRCLQTTFAFVTGQYLARNHRVLYLNFEGCSGLADVLGRRFEGEFSQLLYYLQEPAEDFRNRLYRMVESVNGMEMIPPALCGYDLFGMRAEEWQRLLGILQNSRYEYVILDLSDGIQGLFDILHQCSRVFTIVREDGFAAAKLSQYENALKKADFMDVLEKTRKIKLPVFQRLPRDLNHPAGELTDFVERMLKADESGGL